MENELYATVEVDPIEDLKNEAWEQQEPAYQKLMRLQSETPEAVYGKEALRASVAEAPEGVFCIDERAKPADGKPRVSIAGSGVLLNTEDTMKMVEKLHAANLKYATCHEGCGACKLFVENYAKAHGKTKELDPMEIGRSVAKSLAEHLDMDTEPMLVGYSEHADIPMRGDSRLHDARAIVIDGTGRFNPDKLGFPEAFLHSARYYPHWQAVHDEVGVAISIANGDHGFGHQRFLQAKLPIVIVGFPDDPEYSPTIIKEKLRTLLDVHDQYVVTLDLSIEK